MCKEKPSLKLLIASDIHGSALYCGELLKAYDREKADRMLLLGDILYHGPRNDLPDGYAPHDLLLHVVDLEEDRIVLTKNLNELVDEPEGIDLRGRWAYVVFHTAREPRHSKLWRFRLR